MSSSFAQELRRPLVPNGCLRAPWHDYRSRCIYMITINAAPGMPPFSTLAGRPGDHYHPPLCVRTEIGEIIHNEISAIKSEFPHTSILRRVIMPEHIHFVIFVRATGPYHLGNIISHFKAQCTRRLAGYQTVRSSGYDEKLPPVFEHGYHDRILLKEGQLPRLLHYVSDNPRRRLLRMANPGFHTRSMIASNDGLRYEAYGNILLLDDPDIEAVKISRRYSPEELRRNKLNWKHTVENCGVLVSPFISDAEKRVRDWAMENGGRIILIQENGFAPRFAPKGKLHDLCSEGRLLIVAPTAYSASAVPLTRSLCESMNTLAADIAAGNFRRI